MQAEVDHILPKERQLSASQVFWLSLAVALLYGLSGRLGLLLAVPPGFATAVFPPAGIALAAVLLFGRRILPAIFLGSALMNLSLTMKAAPFSTPALLVALGIGLAAALQALTGQFLIRKILSRYLTVQDIRSVVMFLILAGPVSSIVNATASVTLLSYVGVIKQDTFLFNWSMWWIGDSIGAMVFTPVLMALSEAPILRWTQRKMLAVVPSMVLFLMVVAFYLFSSHQINEKLRLQFQQRVTANPEFIAGRIEHYRLVLSDMERLFSASRRVTRQEFEVFVANQLEDETGVRALEWLPRVEGRERARFTSAARQSGLPGYEIREFGPDGRTMRKAGDRSTYYPVRYFEPVATNQVAMGYDVMSSDSRRPSVQTAIDSGEIVALVKERLSQDGETPVPSLIMSLAVYDHATGKTARVEERRRSVRGLVSGIFRIDALMMAALERADMTGVNFMVLDGDMGVLYKNTDSAEDEKYASPEQRRELMSNAFTFSVPFAFAGQRWSLVFFPTSSYIASNTDLTAWSIFASGMLLVIMLQSLMLVASWRTSVVQTLVVMKTREIQALVGNLNQLNADLEQRVEERTRDLQTERDRFKQVTETIDEVFWMTDPTDFAMLYISPSYERIWQQKCEDLYRNPRLFLEAVHPDDRERVVAALAQQIHGDYDIEYRIIRPDGTMRWIRDRAFPVRDHEGRVQRLVGTAMDITTRIEAEERRNALEKERARLEVSERGAREASRLKSEFLANMSHEIRTPINGVLGMATLLLDTEMAGEQREYTEHIVRSADTLLTIINDILDLSKAEAGRVELEVIDFDLGQLVDDVEGTLALLAKKKDLELRVEVAPDVPRSLRGDPTRLRQVLMNLTNNAIKFTSSGGVTISVQARPLADGRVETRFEVRDTGIGIPVVALDRLFQAFSQADNSTTRRFGGTGLGLSISRNLVELMGGEIGVESAEGMGSTFWFRLELERAHDVEVITLPASEPQADLKLRILLAEDNSVNQLIAVKMLQKMGHAVVVAANGKEAIEALRIADYDLILMDCQMPELDGYETTRFIRSSPELNRQGIKIIAMTANAMAGDREKCLSAGMDDYVAKPIKPGDLASVIERTIARSKAA